MEGTGENITVYCRDCKKDGKVADYGEEQLDVLAIHYSSVVDRKECQLEWDMLKQCISANFRKEKLLLNLNCFMIVPIIV